MSFPKYITVFDRRIAWRELLRIRRDERRRIIRRALREMQDEPQKPLPKKGDGP